MKKLFKVFLFSILLLVFLFNTPLYCQLPTAQQIASQMQVGCWNMGLFDRSTGEVLGPGLLNALIDTSLVSEVHGSIANPSEFHLGQNYPNPFNPYTRINYQIPQGVNESLKIYNVLGKKVETLVNKYQYAGSYSVQFNASNLSNGKQQQCSGKFKGLAVCYRAERLSKSCVPAYCQ